MASQEEYLRAIQRKCLDCCGGQREEVAACGIAACPLYPYRLGERQGKLLDMQDAPPHENSQREWPNLFGQS